MCVGNERGASDILLTYIHFQMEVCSSTKWKCLEEAEMRLLCQKATKRRITYFPSFHERLVLSRCCLGVCSLLSLQASGMADEMCGSHSADFHIRVEILPCTWARRQRHRENDYVSLQVLQNTVPSRLHSCAPPTMEIEFSVCSWLLVWELTAMLAGHPVHRGKVAYKGTKSGTCIIS